MLRLDVGRRRAISCAAVCRARMHRHPRGRRALSMDRNLNCVSTELARGGPPNRVRIHGQGSAGGLLGDGFADECGQAFFQAMRGWHGSQPWKRCFREARSKALFRQSGGSSPVRFSRQTLTNKRFDLRCHYLARPLFCTLGAHRRPLRSFSAVWRGAHPRLRRPLVKYPTGWSLATRH